MQQDRLLLLVITVISSNVKKITYQITRNDYIFRIFNQIYYKNIFYFVKMLIKWQSKRKKKCRYVQIPVITLFIWNEFWCGNLFTRFYFDISMTYFCYTGGIMRFISLYVLQMSPNRYRRERNLKYREHVCRLFFISLCFINSAKLSSPSATVLLFTSPNNKKQTFLKEFEIIADVGISHASNADKICFVLLQNRNCWRPWRYRCSSKLAWWSLGNMNNWKG